MSGFVGSIRGVADSTGVGRFCEWVCKFYEWVCRFMVFVDFMGFVDSMGFVDFIIMFVGSTRGFVDST